MSSNDGRKLLVFGLGFAQHDNRKMQQVLRHYDRMPSTPGSRALLFVELTKLAKELEMDEDRRTQAQQLTDWMRDGGDFPLGLAPAPINAAQHRQPASPASYFTPAHMPYLPHIDNRFGPGQRLTYPEDDDDDMPDVPAQAPQLGYEGGDGNAAIAAQHDVATEGYGGGFPDQAPWAAPDDFDPEPEAAALEDEQPAMGGLDEVQPNHLDALRWRRAPQIPDDRFRGHGRTFDDVDEAADTIENQTEPVPVLRHNANHDGNMPRLRPDDLWRGNNVHGIGVLGMPFGGMGLAVPNRRAGRGHRPRLNLDMHMGGIAAAHPGRRHRPRMEHDLEDEDDFDDPWGVAPGHFALGPGRTLNDPEPAQAVGEDRDHNAYLSSDEEIGDNNGLEKECSAAPDDRNCDPIECPICLEEYPPSGFPKGTLVTDQCDHPDKACLQCLESSITAIVETGALHILACPICPQKLTRRDVKEYASKRIYERYKYLKQQALIPGHYISCTNINCGGSQAHNCNGPSGPKMVCNFCQAETCAKHRRPWHNGQTCVEFDMDPVQMERLEEEEATAKLLALEETSICPKCGQGVTKIEGCDHMMCQCGTEWCYVCSCSWENILRLGPTAHRTFCIYHPNKVNLTKAQQEAARERIMGLVHGGEVSPELTKARDEFRLRRRLEMRPKLAEAAEARMTQALEQQKRQIPFPTEQAPHKKTKVKLVPAWEEGGSTKWSW